MGMSPRIIGLEVNLDTYSGNIVTGEMKLYPNIKS